MFGDYNFVETLDEDKVNLLWGKHSVKCKNYTGK